MQTIYTINTAHLAAVKAGMVTLGIPTVGAFWNGRENTDYWAGPLGM